MAPPETPAPPRAGEHADLVVAVLGPLEVTIGGVQVERWVSGRGLAVFRYLVLNRERAVPRERLMDLLWPWADPQAARNNLNVAMYGLRRSLREADPVEDRPHVVYRDGCYGLAPGLSVRSDVEDLEASLARARCMRDAGRVDEAIGWLEHAVSLRRGPLFEDDTAAEWHLSERQRIDELCADAWEELAGLRFGRGDVAGSADACRSLLELDNCNESAHRMLMRTYVAQRKYHHVARQYAECVTNLRDELDIGPDFETTDLFQQLLNHRRDH
ncbi:MAG: BTAD domain-containing putative transcriptional regulator [Actinomycetota bacterium]|nr:BTAD domain-containing putative transcriptional regulator [Actinomycetota bacterium]